MEVQALGSWCLEKEHNVSSVTIFVWKLCVQASIFDHPPLAVSLGSMEPCEGSAGIPFPGRTRVTAIVHPISFYITAR